MSIAVKETHVYTCDECKTETIHFPEQRRPKPKGWTVLRLMMAHDRWTEITLCSYCTEQLPSCIKEPQE